MIRIMVALPACALLLGACSLRLPVERIPVKLGRDSRNPPVATDGQGLVPVYLLSDRYHTGMVFCYSWLLEHGFVPPAGFPADTLYVCMSWGNRDAYSHQGLNTPYKWLRVLLTPTPSVMELIPCNWSVPEVLPGQRIWLKMVERERGTGLAHFLNQCTKDGPSGRPIVVEKSSWGNGVQLEADASYFVPRVCNVWTAQAIESMGYPINPWLGITASSLVAQLEAPPHQFALIWPGGGIPSSTVNP